VDESFPKGVWFGGRDQFLHAQLWTSKIFCHGTTLTEINNAAINGDGGSLM